MLTSSKSKPTIPKPYLEFKYNKNAMLGDLGDGAMHLIPSRMINQTTPQHERMVRNPSTGRLEARAAVITTPEFDLDHIHRIELANELAILPKRLAGMSTKHHERLCDLSYETAAEAKIHNDRIRQRVRHYCDEGTISLVSDAFEGETEVEGLEESAVIQAAQVEIPTQPTPVKNQTVKPTTKPRKTATKKVA